MKLCSNALISALLHGRRDRTALAEATIAVAKSPLSAAATCCILNVFRCANRTEALESLKRAATGDALTMGSGCQMGSW